MREIKFRAWDKKYNMMIQAESFQRDQMWISGIGEVFEIGEWSDYGGGGKTEDDCSDQYILMQYTGLRDKNGKEIYEGDIIKGEAIVWADSGHYSGTRETTGVVSFEHARFYLEDSETGARTDLAMGAHYHEIIGNIYEHPHLLKGESE